MALREISRTREEIAAIDARFGIAQDIVPELPEERAEKLAVQAEVRGLIRQAAQVLDEGVTDSRLKSSALTHLEEALMWARKAIFS